MRCQMLVLLGTVLLASHCSVAVPEAISEQCDWGKYAPSSNPAFVWTQVAPGDGGTSWYLRIHPADSDCVLHSCDMSATYLTNDGNRSYHSCNNPDWGFPRMHYVSAVDFCRQVPEVGYAGCESNGIFKTIDRGRSWSRVSTASLEEVFQGRFPRVPVSALAVHPGNPEIVWFGIGFPRRLEMRGKRRLPQGLAVSRDGGKSWQHRPDAFPPGEMAVSIRILPEMPDTIFVGTDYGVYRSDDGGRTFRSIEGNLPTSTFGGIDVVYDSEQCRPVVAAALEANYYFDGDHGAHATGGVWVSDGGDGKWHDATGDLRFPDRLLSTLPECQSNSPWASAAMRFLWREFFAEPESQALYREVVLDCQKDPAPFHRAWNKRKSDETRIALIQQRLKQECDGFLPNFHTVRIDPRNPRVLYVSIFDPVPPFGIWKSIDGGKKWHCVTRGARMWEMPEWQCYIPEGESKRNITQAWTERHPMNYGTPDLAAGFWDIRKFDLAESSPEVLVFHSHRVTYRSENGGTSWLDISNRIVDATAHTFAGAGNSNMCVFDLEFHPQAPDRVLMWMADCGLKLSTDNGKTLHALPNAMVGSNQWVLGAAFDPADPERFYAAFDCRDWLLKGLRGMYFLESRDFGKHFVGVLPGESASLPAKQPEFTAQIANLRVDPHSPPESRRILATHTNLGRYAVCTGFPAFPTAAPALGIIETRDGGKSWQPLNQGLENNKNVVALQASEDFQTLYAAVAMPLKNANGPGGLYRSTDSGRLWRKIVTPIDSVADVRAIHGKLFIAGGVKCVKSPVTNDGGVYVSDDGGQTWRRLLAAPLVSNVAVSAVNPQLIYCTVERDRQNLMGGFGVYRSGDGGQTWQRVNCGLAGAYNFTTLKFHPMRSHQLWLGTYGSGFYWLEDSAGKQYQPGHP